MAIKERWHRMIRKSVSSPSSPGRNGTDSIDEPGQSLSKHPGGLSRLSNWRADKTAASTKPPRDSFRSGHASFQASAGKQSNNNSSNNYNNNNNNNNNNNKGKNAKNAKSTKLVNLHPSERPLTESNIKHQEILGSFTWKFGHNRQRRQSREQATAQSRYSTISPRCSSAVSFVDPAGDRSRASSSAAAASSVCLPTPGLMHPEEEVEQLGRDNESENESESEMEEEEEEKGVEDVIGIEEEDGYQFDDDDDHQHPQDVDDAQLIVVEEEEEEEEEEGQDGHAAGLSVRQPSQRSIQGPKANAPIMMVTQRKLKTLRLKAGGRFSMYEAQG